jgi:Tfp pilus assembly protein PilO
MQFPGEQPMKRISREKRNQLIIVTLATLAVLGLIYFSLIRPQYASLSQIAQAKTAADIKLKGIKNTVTNANETAKELDEISSALNHTETDMASGDPYSWTYDTLRHFKQPYKVEIPEVGHPTISEMDLLPSFPYKQIRFSVNGTAYYHDLGKFISDFENNFPHNRVINLAIEPTTGGDGNNEKLSFRMEIIALVKPNPS